MPIECPCQTHLVIHFPIEVVKLITNYAHILSEDFREIMIGLTCFVSTSYEGALFQGHGSGSYFTAQRFGESQFPIFRMEFAEQRRMILIIVPYRGQAVKEGFVPLDGDWYSSLIFILSPNNRKNTWPKCTGELDDSESNKFERICDLMLSEITVVIDRALDDSDSIIVCPQTQRNDRGRNYLDKIVQNIF
jgi:hypothetical protein